MPLRGGLPQERKWDQEELGIPASLQGSANEVRGTVGQWTILTLLLQVWGTVDMDSNPTSWSCAMGPNSRPRWASTPSAAKGNFKILQCGRQAAIRHLQQWKQCPDTVKNPANDGIRRFYIWSLKAGSAKGTLSAHAGKLIMHLSIHIFLHLPPSEEARGCQK